MLEWRAQSVVDAAEHVAEVLGEHFATVHLVQELAAGADVHAIAEEEGGEVLHEAVLQVRGALALQLESLTWT